MGWSKKLLIVLGGLVALHGGLVERHLKPQRLMCSLTGSDSKAHTSPATWNIGIQSSFSQINEIEGITLKDNFFIECISDQGIVCVLWALLGRLLFGNLYCTCLSVRHYAGGERKKRKQIMKSTGWVASPKSPGWPLLSLIKCHMLPLKPFSLKKWTEINWKSFSSKTHINSMRHKSITPEADW